TTAVPLAEIVARVQPEIGAGMRHLKAAPASGSAPHVVRPFYREAPTPACSGLAASLYACHPRPVNGYAEAVPAARFTPATPGTRSARNEAPCTLWRSPPADT